MIAILWILGFFLCYMFYFSVQENDAEFNKIPSWFVFLLSLVWPIFVFCVICYAAWESPFKKKVKK